jgi:hypothetical protein
VNHDDQADALASKVDALIAKRNAGDATAADARNIPVLTDLIDAPAWSPRNPSPLHTLSPAPTDVLASLSDDDIDALSQEILARVSQRIDAELATSLKARLHEHLQSQINAAVTHALADMKLGIANDIGDVVNAALADRLRRT